MKLLTLTTVLFLIACGTTTRKPESVTPKDSVVTQVADTDAQNTRILRWGSDALNKVFDITAGMKNEIGLCGFGHVSTDTAFVDDVTFPGTLYSGNNAVIPNQCPEGTFLLWHNHPYSGFTAADSAAGFRIPSDLCKMDWPDVATSYKLGAAWVSVATAAKDSLWLCWWSKKQVDSVYRSLGGLHELKRVKGQGIIGDRHVEPVNKERGQP